VDTPDERLVIELDGAPHFTKVGSLNDFYRDQDLADIQIRVLRFENKFVFQQIDWVLAEIVANFNWFDKSSDRAFVLPQSNRPSMF
jgi:very-short-patch-repair endonuclease